MHASTITHTVWQLEKNVSSFTSGTASDRWIAARTKMYLLTVSNLTVFVSLLKNIRLHYRGISQPGMSAKTLPHLPGTAQHNTRSPSGAAAAPIITQQQQAAAVTEPNFNGSHPSISKLMTVTSLTDSRSSSSSSAVFRLLRRSSKRPKTPAKHQPISTTRCENGPKALTEE